MEKEYGSDEFFMRAAISEARKALDKGEVPIGAVVVASGRIVGRGHNLVETLSDATAHAEMQALTAAMQAAGGKYLPECTLYVTVEPCAMCAGASAWAQVGRIVYGAADPKRGFSIYGRAGTGTDTHRRVGAGAYDGIDATSKSILHPKTEVMSGILAQECAELMTTFFKNLR